MNSIKLVVKSDKWHDSRTDGFPKENAYVVVIYNQAFLVASFDARDNVFRHDIMGATSVIDATTRNIPFWAYYQDVKYEMKTKADKIEKVKSKTIKIKIKGNKTTIKNRPKTIKAKPVKVKSVKVKSVKKVAKKKIVKKGKKK